MAELPIIIHNVNAALTLKPSQILVTAAEDHIEAMKQARHLHPPALDAHRNAHRL